MSGETGERGRGERGEGERGEEERGGGEGRGRGEGERRGERGGRGEDLEAPANGTAARTLEGSSRALLRAVGARVRGE